MDGQVKNIAEIARRELISAKSGERYSLSAVLSHALGFEKVFVHHEILPPGRRASAPHSHLRQEEMILVLRGNPTAHVGSRAHTLKAGDFLGFRPGAGNLHFVENAGADESELLVIASGRENKDISYEDGPVAEEPWSPVPDAEPRPDPVLKTQRLTLRTPQEGDVPAIVRYFKENEARFAPTDPPRPPDFYQADAWRERVRRFGESWKSEQALRLYLFDRETEEIVGTLSFSQMSRGPLQACHLGYGLGGAHEGRGLMTEALQEAIRYLFDERNFHRIMANHLPGNERSARVLKRLGFVTEGIAKDYLFINGQWRDHVLNSLTNRRWKPAV